MKGIFPSSIVTISQSFLTEIDDSIIPISKKRSYKEVWKRAKRKIIMTIRLEKMISQYRLPPESSYTGPPEEYLKRKSIDFSLGVESKSLTSNYVFNPHSKFISFWQMLISLILLYSAIMSPFSLAFLLVSIGDPLFTIDVFIDILFMIDLLIILNTGYFDDNGILINKRKLMLMTTLKSWLIIDIISSIPLSLIELILQDQGFISRLRAFPKLLRLSRVIKLINNIGKLENIEFLFIISQKSWRLFKVILGSLLSLHFVACFWYYSSVLFEFSPETWVYRYRYLDLSTGDKYLTSLYWALTTLVTIGYGEIVPYTYLEKTISMCWMVMGVYLLSFSVGNLASVAVSFETIDKVVTEKMALAERFGKATKSNAQTLHRLKRHIRLNDGNILLNRQAKESMFEVLPMKIKHEVACNIFKGSVGKFGFFTTKEESFIANIALYLESVVFANNSVIWEKGEASSGIYFIDDGYAYYFLTKDLKICTLKEGQYFGDIEIVNNSERRFLVKSSITCSLLLLPIRVIPYIKRDFPKVWEEIERTAAVRENNLYQLAAERAVLKRIKTENIELADSQSCKLLIKAELERLKAPENPSEADHLNNIEAKLETLTRSLQNLHKLFYEANINS